MSLRRCTGAQLSTIVLLSFVLTVLIKLYFAQSESLHVDANSINLTRWAEANQTVKIQSTTHKKIDTSAYSYRDRVHTDTRPQHIFGPSNIYRDIKGFDKLAEIPHIIHETSKNSTLSVIFQDWMISWRKLNPRWQYWFWTDKDIEKFISTRYPNFKQIFSNYKHGIQRADVFRYFVLYEYGGLYADCDVECLKPLDAKMAEGDCLLTLQPPIHALAHFGRSRLICNAIMACRPRHPFFEYLINSLTKDKRNERPNVLTSTGPLMVDDVYDEFAEKSGDIPPLASPELFQPIADPRYSQLFMNKCKDILSPSQINDVAKKICAPFLSGDPEQLPKQTNKSITIHHWSHSWTSGFRKDKFGNRNETRTFSITDLGL